MFLCGNFINNLLISFFSDTTSSESSLTYSDIVIFITCLIVLSAFVLFIYLLISVKKSKLNQRKLIKTNAICSIVLYSISLIVGIFYFVSPRRINIISLAILALFYLDFLFLLIKIKKGTLKFIVYISCVVVDYYVIKNNPNNALPINIALFIESFLYIAVNVIELVLIHNDSSLVVISERENIGNKRTKKYQDGITCRKDLIVNNTVVYVLLAQVLVLCALTAGLNWPIYIILISFFGFLIGMVLFVVIKNKVFLTRYNKFRNDFIFEDLEKMDEQIFNDPLVSDGTKGLLAFNLRNFSLYVDMDKFVKYDILLDEYGVTPSVSFRAIYLYARKLEATYSKEEFYDAFSKAINTNAKKFAYKCEKECRAYYSSDPNLDLKYYFKKLNDKKSKINVAFSLFSLACYYRNIGNMDNFNKYANELKTKFPMCVPLIKDLEGTSLQEQFEEAKQRLNQDKEENSSSKLEKVCPSCGKLNKPDSKFCSNCGAKLDD